MNIYGIEGLDDAQRADVERLARLLAAASDAERHLGAVVAVALLADLADLGPVYRPAGEVAPDVDSDAVAALAALLARLPVAGRRAAYRAAAERLLDQLDGLDGLRVAVDRLAALAAVAAQVPTAADRDWLDAAGIADTPGGAP